MAKLETGKASETAANLVQTFAACANFPKERAGVDRLADALKRAAADFRIPMEQIVQACADVSTWCPVPRELRNVAIGLRDERRRKTEGDQESKWRQIYGPPDMEWSADLIKVLAGASHEEKKRAIHIRAIRDMLFYTEGDGREQGDRKFWEGSAHSFTGRAFDNAHYPDMVAAVRAAGGWRTERELEAENPAVRF